MDDSSESIQKKFANWKDLLESKSLKINNLKSKSVMIGFKGDLSSAT